ncbi:hypothetical protein C369_07416 [Cryptococcus neoformans A5-35-17]|nr:hypothetical protein C369_07416 [Cryptococcus neoformans var. grubii A5-35-17]
MVKYPNFADRVHQALVDVFGEKGRKIVTHHAEDGSGVGSAIIAGKFIPCTVDFTDHPTAMTKVRKEAGVFVQY